MSQAKLLWRCRRGMLELDLLLQRFTEMHWHQLSFEQVKALDRLLKTSDPELLSWLMGHADPLDRELFDLVTLIRLYDKA